MDKLLENAASLEGYTLYPDAGDMGELDTPSAVPQPPNMPTPPVPPPTAAQATPPMPLPEPPSTVSVIDPPRLPRSRRRRSVVRTGGAVVLAGAAVCVYACLLTDGLLTLRDEGIGALAAKAVFGSTRHVTTQETAPPKATAPLLPPETAVVETPAETMPPETASPPANEQPSPQPVTEIIAMDLSSRQADGLGLINETPYTPDLAALAATDPVIDSYDALESIYGKDCPAVLILHTHGTEAFQDQAMTGYHTTDESRSIVQVGKALAEVLTEAGIGVIRCTEPFDKDSFDMAYYNAARYIRETLEEHPSIRYILDIHRDAITNAEGKGIRPLSVENGSSYAQLMFVVGTDHGGSGHTEWETNLALAARLQSRLHQTHPTLLRDINLRSASFNAQYAPGALLIEAGAACSTLDDAVQGIRLLGEALAEEILQEQK